MYRKSLSRTETARLFSFCENGIHLVYEVTLDDDVRLLHFSPLPFDEAHIGPEEARRRFRLVELQVSGQDHATHHGAKHIGTMPGTRLKHQALQDYQTDLGRKIEIVLLADNLVVTSHMQFVDGIPAVRTWTTVENQGGSSQGIEYVSSFALTGIAKEGEQTWDKKCVLGVPHSTWYGETQWRTAPLPEWGLNRVHNFSLKRVACSNTGTWSTAEYLPMGFFQNVECNTCLAWQIEHNGSWHWEIGEAAIWPSRLGEIDSEQLYLLLSGPTENENHWWKCLEPGESFAAAPVAICAVLGDAQDAIAALTKYRRKIRRPNRDNEQLTVIFNDYMHGLLADPSTDKEIPLIDAAAEAGCECYCIDAGWFSEGNWWEAVGEWEPARKRFPGGLKRLFDYIRVKGMIPGLWVEIEVMGTGIRLAHHVPDDWFFQRHGARVIDHGRYQLDFRNPQVVAYADHTIDKFVLDYGIGYLKIDYNINAGPGTEFNADSFGDGLFEHNRAYIRWLERILERHPDLIVENCSSGGMRMDYGMMRLHSVAAASDQTDYRKTAVIAAASASAVTPEQAAVWSYPRQEADQEEIIFNMVNAMLLRVYQGGRIDLLSSEAFALVQKGISLYKSIRKDIPKSLPFWPLGMPHFGDGWVSCGLRTDHRGYLSVWRLDSAETSCVLPMTCLGEDVISIQCVYPSYNCCLFEWHEQQASLVVHLPDRFRARVFEFALRRTNDIRDAG